MNDNRLRAHELSKKIIENAKNRLILKLRFLDTALCALKLHPSDGGTISTEGYYFHYDPKHILITYKNDENTVTRDYLHTVLHCIFKHSFVSPAVNPHRWNLACDIAVENIIDQLGVKELESPRSAAQKKVLGMINGHVKFLSAEKIYRLLTEYDLSKRQFEELREPFFADDHDKWYIPPDDTEDDGSGEGSNSANQEQESEEQSFSSSQESSDNSRNNSRSRIPSRDQLSDMWSDISKRAQVDLETTSKEWGDKTDDLTQTLGALNRERYDYSEFLRRFAAYGETMKISDNEFDYIFYTYGLKLYKDMPLIEPLEYKDEKRIREFAIVIDTSGSVEGEKVQRFVQKTYNLLKQTENFFTRVNIHILQADAEVKEDVKITCHEDLETYISRMKLTGFGGTDFRPAFQHIDKLIDNKEFTDFRGLIYFTDGEGIYPEKMPAYPAAFLFVDKDVPPSVPSWAIQLILDEDEFEEQFSAL